MGGVVCHHTTYNIIGTIIKSVTKHQQQHMGNGNGGYLVARCK